MAKAAETLTFVGINNTNGASLRACLINENDYIITQRKRTTKMERDVEIAIGKYSVCTTHVLPGI